MTEELCSSCEKVQKQYNDLEQPVNLLTICLPVKVLLLNKQHSEKKHKKKEFVKKISAIRNSGGGKALIHLLGKSDNDRYLGNLDQFTDDLFPDLIEDGTVYADNFFRSFLCDQNGFKEHTEFVVLDVRSSSSISTAHFNTRVCSDQSVRRPTRFNVLSLLRSRAKKTIKRPAERLQEAPKCLKLDDLHESRSLQLKTFPKDKITDIQENPSELANFIWINLRLREYVCSMSMLDNGGSYYLGIKEKKITIAEGVGKYNSKIPVIFGVPLNEEVKVALRSELLERSKTDIRVFCKKEEGGIVSSPVENILDIKWHNDNPAGVVCEAVVQPVRGVVFFDCGPKSYHIVKNEIVELATDTWFQKIQESVSLDASGLLGEGKQYRLTDKVAKHMAKEMVVPTSHCFPPTLMGIEDSVDDIRSHVIGMGGTESNIYPLHPKISPLKDHSSILNNVKDLTQNENGLVFASKSMAVTLNIKECRSFIPEELIYDIFIAGETFPATFITITEDESELPSESTRIYNAKVKKGILKFLRMFTDENVTVVHGCLTTKIASDMSRFKECLNEFREEESISAIPDSLEMNPGKCSAVCNAFIHGASSTRAVFSDTKILGSLTKKQFEIVSETLNSSDNVTVQSRPSSGASTLLMDLADRLEVAGKTLLVCKKASDAKIAREMSTDKGSNLTVLQFEDVRERRKHINNADHKFILIESSIVQAYEQPESGVRIRYSTPSSSNKCTSLLPPKRLLILLTGTGEEEAAPAKKGRTRSFTVSRNSSEDE